MGRPRLHAHRRHAGGIGRFLLAALALAIVWYGLMVVLLALKVAPHTVNELSAYRTVYDKLASIQPADVTGTVRAIAAAAGVLAFLIFGFLALRQLPRPHLAPRWLTLSPAAESAARARGETTVSARAVEHMAEATATQQPSVGAVSARLATDELQLDVHVRGAELVPEALGQVRQRVAEAMRSHELPPMPVGVVLTGLDPVKRRELR